VSLNFHNFLFSDVFVEPTLGVLLGLKTRRAAGHRAGVPVPDGEDVEAFVVAPDSEGSLVVN